MYGYPRNPTAATFFRLTQEMFRPTDYPNAALWLHTNDLVPMYGAGNHRMVETWPARIAATAFTGSLLGGGGGNGIRAPALVRGKNGCTGVAFNGNQLTSSWMPPTGANARSFVAVVSHTTVRGGGNAGMIFGYGTASTNTQWFYGMLSTAVIGMNNFPTNYSSGASGSASDFDIIIVTYNGTTLAQYVNGGSASAAVTLNTGSTFGLRLGTGVGDGVNPGTFVLYEFAAFTDTLTSTEADAIYKTLQRQYQTGNYA